MKMSIFIDFTVDGAEEEELKMISPEPTMPLDSPARRAVIDEVICDTAAMMFAGFTDLKIESCDPPD